jgi:phage N-6-adenine-methyltransferase
LEEKRVPSLGGETTVSATDVWLTPPAIIKALGEFDLDPCASLDRPWDTAGHHYTIEDDGLKQEWFGRVWCNPPYGKAMAPFLEKMVAHGNGVVLIFARTETKAFFDYVWNKADAILFMKGRVKFHLPDGSQGGTAGAPSVLIAYGAENVKALETCGIPGKIVYLNT